MVELSVIRDLVAIFGVIAGFSYYVLTVRATRRNQDLQLETRQTQLFMYLYEKWSSEDFQRKSIEIRQLDLDDLQNMDLQHLNKSELDTYVKILTIGCFYEGLGVLVKNGQVKPELVDDLMSQNIINSWEMTRPFIFQQRTDENYPNKGEWFEYLYNQIKPIYDKQHPELAL